MDLFSFKALCRPGFSNIRTSTLIHFGEECGVLLLGKSKSPILDPSVVKGFLRSRSIEGTRPTGKGPWSTDSPLTLIRSSRRVRDSTEDR